jgi:hypothetical protein
MRIILLLCVMILVGCDVGNPEVDKIIRAKQVVLSQLNFPDTARFHEMSTSVRGNTVTLTVTAKNAFGVPSTHTFNIEVD